MSLYGFICDSYVKDQLDQNSAVLKSLASAFFGLDFYCSWCGRGIFKAEGKVFTKSTWKNLFTQAMCAVCWYGSKQGIWDLASYETLVKPREVILIISRLTQILSCSNLVKLFTKFSSFHESTPLFTKLKVLPCMLGCFFFLQHNICKWIICNCFLLFHFFPSQGIIRKAW